MLWKLIDDNDGMVILLMQRQERTGYLFGKKSCYPIESHSETAQYLYIPKCDQSKDI